MIRRALIGLAAFVLLGGTVACGDDEDEPAGDDTEEAATDDGDEADDGDDAEADGRDGADVDGSDDADDEAEAEDDAGPAQLEGVSSDEFCAEVRVLEEDAEVDASDPDELLAVLERLERVDAPAEIETEWDEFFSGLRQIYGAEGQGGPDEMNESEFDDFMKAAETVEVYMARVCGT
jgi:hypothetical protein